MFMAEKSTHYECPKWETCAYGEILWWTEGIPNKACCYILHTGEPRGCDVQNCDKYKKRTKSREKAYRDNFKII